MRTLICIAILSLPALLFSQGEGIGLYELEPNPKTTPYKDSLALIGFDTVANEYYHKVIYPYQVLSISGDTINLTNGGFVIVPKDSTTYGQTNTNNFTVSGNTITNGDVTFRFKYSGYPLASTGGTGTGTSNFDCETFDDSDVSGSSFTSPKELPSSAADRIIYFRGVICTEVATPSHIQEININNQTITLNEIFESGDYITICTDSSSN